MLPIQIVALEHWSWSWSLWFLVVWVWLVAGGAYSFEVVLVADFVGGVPFLLVVVSGFFFLGE